MSWKPIAAVVGLIIYLIVFISICTYRLTDKTCGIDKGSLEKRCQKAIEHYKGRQVNL